MLPLPQHTLSRCLPHFSPRSCTDIICCVLFFLFILGYIAVGILGEFLAGQSWGSGWGTLLSQGGTIPWLFPLKSVCPAPGDVSACLYLQPGCTETPNKSSTQELHGGLLRDRGKQVSKKTGKRAGGRCNRRWTGDHSTSASLNLTM